MTTLRTPAEKSVTTNDQPVEAVAFLNEEPGRLRRRVQSALGCRAEMAREAAVRSGGALLLGGFGVEETPWHERAGALLADDPEGRPWVARFAMGRMAICVAVLLCAGAYRIGRQAARARRAATWGAVGAAAVVISVYALFATPASPRGVEIGPDPDARPLPHVVRGADDALARR
jgi:hypothetical protein